ncbi:MAG: ABC transporter substrate-binding protein, partial [Candidatus Dormibacteria bacterium]
SLLEVMKQGPQLGPRGRFRRLTPIVERAFDLPTMTRFAVGPAWSSQSQPEHQALTTAFTRLTAASYAHNFDRWAGERFEVDPKAQQRGADRIVKARIVPLKGAATELLYRVHKTPAGWKIVDVYYGSISQLTTRRADFAQPLAAGGAMGLEKHLNGLVEGLLR